MTVYPNKYIDSEQAVIIFFLKVFLLLNEKKRCGKGKHIPHYPHRHLTQHYGGNKRKAKTTNDSRKKKVENDLKRNFTILFVYKKARFFSHPYLFLWMWWAHMSWQCWCNNIFRINCYTFRIIVLFCSTDKNDVTT